VRYSDESHAKLNHYGSAWIFEFGFSSGSSAALDSQAAGWALLRRPFASGDREKWCRDAPFTDLRMESS
jgi:hypothetical protein